MQPVLFDTSIYIAVLRSKKDAPLRLREMAEGAPVWLSAVVLKELYAGAGAKGRNIVERLENDFDRVKRVLVPNRSDGRRRGRRWRVWPRSMTTSRPDEGD
ncbi:MAG TPA: PIN domain-containing protein [Candidatus Acidoferrum sp.]|nr:PIN domain-containing protein [Candidatus Acidoferrum sp.]